MTWQKLEECLKVGVMHLSVAPSKMPSPDRQKG